MTQHRRVVVVGAGVIGVTTAHTLRADGHDVLLLDAEATAASACSHANGGFLSAAFCAPWAMPGLLRQTLPMLLDRDAPFRFRPDGGLAQWRWLRALLKQCTAEQFGKHRGRMIRLALFSRACLDDIVAQTGIDFDRLQRGVLLLFRQAPQPQLIDARLAAWRALGFHAAWCDASEVRAMEPGLAPTAPVAGGLVVHDDACGDCHAFVQALLGWNLARGLRYEPNTRIDALEMDASGRVLLAVRAGQRRWQADAFVFATGAQTAQLLRPQLDVPVVPVKGYSVTASLAPDQGPMRAVIDDASKLAVARLGHRARLAGMAEVVGHDRRVHAARCDVLVRHYEALYGSLPTAGRSTWSGLRPMTPYGTPIISATSIEGLYLNTGHGTYGWTLACASARLVADLVGGHLPVLDPADYALDPRERA